MSTLYMYYIIDCIQGNSKVGDYIIQICYVASMYVGSIGYLLKKGKDNPNGQVIINIEKVIIRG